MVATTPIASTVITSCDPSTRSGHAHVAGGPRQFCLRVGGYGASMGIVVLDTVSHRHTSGSV